MVKMIFAVRRLPELSPEEFHHYWRTNHGRLAQKNLPVLRAKRYVQTHTLDTPFNEVLRDSRGAGEPYDGIVAVSPNVDNWHNVAMIPVSEPTDVADPEPVADMAPRRRLG